MKVNEEQNGSGARPEKSPASLTKWERDVLRSADENHIWLNAFSCIRPTDAYKIQIANQILGWLNDKEYLIANHQDSEDDTVRELGRLMPQLIVRFNKS